MRLLNLDAETRRYMREEIEHDIQAWTLYLSPRLSAHGQQNYPDLLLGAADTGDPGTLAVALSQGGRLNEMETAVRNGRPHTKRVPVNAAETMAEGEFNRFYVRAVSRRALTHGIDSVRVYRAKLVNDPRPESEAMIGQFIDAQALLDDLRTHVGIDIALHLPPGPNSGLSVELVS